MDPQYQRGWLGAVAVPGPVVPVRAADGDDRVPARDRGGGFPEAAYRRFAERKLREEFIL